MNSSLIQNEEYLSLDGPFGPAPVIFVCLLVLGLFGWTLWCERTVLKPKQIFLFWCLRATALAAVVWMLLSPSNVRIETSTTRKTVAIYADVSDSMRTVDPAGSADDSRWFLAQSDGDVSVIELSDRALAAINLAHRHLLEAREAIKYHEPEKSLIDSSLHAQAAFEHAQQHLEAVADGQDVSANVRALAKKALDLQTAPEFVAFVQLCVALRKGQIPAEHGWRESFSDLEFRTAGVRQVLSELSRVAEKDEPVRTASKSAGRVLEFQKQSRLIRTTGLLERLRATSLNRLREQADFPLSSFGQTVNRLSDGFSFADGNRSDATAKTSDQIYGTDLSAVFESLKQMRETQHVAAAIVLTDVSHNAPGVPHPSEAAAKVGTLPVYIVPVGNSDHVRDLILQNVSAPKVAMRNDDIVIEVNLQTYQCQNETCTVKLLQDGNVVDFRELTLDSDFAQRTVRFDCKVPAAGMQLFQVAVDPITGEFTEENNFAEFEVNVTRSDIKILLADEMPRWEYRYLAQLFRRDEKVECDELLYRPRMIATGRREASQTMPVTVDEWDQYDVVILGDLPPEHFPVASQESLLEYLRVRGGTLVVIAGQSSMPELYHRAPLETAIPVQLSAPVGPMPTSGYAFRLTQEGRDHPAMMIGESDQATQIAWDFINQFAPLQDVSPWRIPRPTAHTLISAVPRDAAETNADWSQSAFLSWQPLGRGRAVYLAGPESYRLRFLKGDQFHHRFWGQLLRWSIASDLSLGSELVRIRSDKTRYTTREPVQVTVRLNDAATTEPTSQAESLQLNLTSDDREQTVPLVESADIPGQFTAEITALPPGVYKVEPVGARIDALLKNDASLSASASFTVSAELPRELIDTRCDRALAMQLAGITGGQVIPPTAIAEILSLTDLEPIVTKHVERKPLWVEWKYLWIVFGCLQFEWIVRKWKGLS